MKLSAFLKKSSFIAKSYYQSLQNINMLGKILMEYHNLPTLQTSFSSLPFMYECAFLLSHVQLFAIPWTIDHEATLSMGFSRQEYWSRLPFPPPGDLPTHLFGLLHCQVDSANCTIQEALIIQTLQMQCQKLGGNNKI